MNEVMNNQAQMTTDIRQQLESPDPEIRRSAAEIFLSEALPDDLLPVLCPLIMDSEKSVRDAAGFALIYNENPGIAPNIVQYISSENIAVRNLAGEILIKKGSQSVPAIVKYLEGKNSDDQKFLIDILGLIGDASPVAEIVKVLKESDNENVVLACIEALGNIGAPEVLEDLFECYMKNELYRPTTVEALGKIGTSEVLDFILANYHDADELTRFSMLESLGTVGSEKTFYFLINEIKDAIPPNTWAIVLSLQKLLEKYGLDLPFDEALRGQILSTLTEADNTYKVPASCLVRYFSDYETLSVCVRVYGEDSEIDANLYSLFEKDITSTIKAIREYLSVDKGNKKSLLELFRMLLTENGNAAVSNMAETDIVNLCDLLASNLENPSEEVRKLAIELLFMLNPDAGILMADTLINDTNVWNRIRLVELLEGYNGEQKIPLLKALADDNDEMVRERAHWALCELKNLNNN